MRKTVRCQHGPNCRFPAPLLHTLHSAFFLFLLGCGSPKPAHPTQAAFEIDYSAVEDGEIWFRHSQIRLRFDSEMYCRVFWQKGERLLSINDIPTDPAKARPTHFIEVDGMELKDFNVDYKNVGMSEIKNQFGTGKCLHLTGYAKTPTGIEIEKSLNVEFYQEYPDMALLWASYRNLPGDGSVQITRTINSFFRLDAARAKAGAPSYAFWCFQGGSKQQGKEAFQITDENFTHVSEMWMEESSSRREFPLMDLWTAEMGMAIGELSSASQMLRVPVRVAPDRKVEISLHSLKARNLGPNETLVTPKNFWMVHGGDYRSALERYTALMRKQS